MQQITDKMTEFVSLSDDKEFKKLDARVVAALTILVRLKESIEALSKKKPFSENLYKA